MKIIACIGFIRSGSTMQYSLLKHVLDAVGTNYSNLGFLKSSDVGSIDWSELKSQYEVCIFKSHDVTILEGLRNLKDCDLKPVFIHRELRDTYLSLKEKIGYEKEGIVKLFEESREVESYVSGAHGILVQCYEEFFYDKKKYLREAVNFCDLQLDEKQVDLIGERKEGIPRWKTYLFYPVKMLLRIRRKLGVSTMQLEKRLLLPAYLKLLKLLTNSETQVHPDHFSKRKGEPGGWADALTQEEKEIFDRLYSKHGKPFSRK